MTTDANVAQNAQDNTKLPDVFVPTPGHTIDFVTILGLVFSFGLIASAIMMGDSNANFFNVPSLLIVLCGTITATSIAYTTKELFNSGSAIGLTIYRPTRQYDKIAISLMALAIIARKRGILALSTYDTQTSKEPFLAKSIQLVVDGFSAQDIERILKDEIDKEIERDERAASMLKRASEIAPAMGLIGTLVGLVQMLADLENPDTIGPAMAVALLTTFYGAILGTVVLSPMAAKLEKACSDNILLKRLSFKAAISIINQENPRNLEMLLNSELPPSDRIIYFD
ncbi:MAG: MotA/TolQ/ExbB proton channel family protein [Alphaproteobacteria bacterium]|nr:MotA/TolQ/ExbB proton channel family protein [Alphaproteobacteria bacterium]